MTRSSFLSFGSALAMVLAPSAASAIELNVGTEALTLSISPQIQPRFEADFDGPPGAAATQACTDVCAGGLTFGPPTPA